MQLLHDQHVRLFEFRFVPSAYHVAPVDCMIHPFLMSVTIEWRLPSA